MIKLIVGHKGTGKTKMMVEMANRDIAEKDGSVVFIIKDDRLKHDLDINIRMIVMDDYEYVNNIDEYIGFIYGIMSSNHDIEVIFIDSIHGSAPKHPKHPSNPLHLLQKCQIIFRRGG